MHFEKLPSEIARNELLFPKHEQQLLKFVIECGGLIGVVVGTKGA